MVFVKIKMVIFYYPLGRPVLALARDTKTFSKVRLLFDLDPDPPKFEIAYSYTYSIKPIPKQQEDGKPITGANTLQPVSVVP
jgi:hypothetical protein